MHVEYVRLFQEASQRLEKMGGSLVEVDFAPFTAAARSLYESALVAERVSGLRAFLQPNGVRLTASMSLGGGKTAWCCISCMGAKLKMVLPLCLH